MVTDCRTRSGLRPHPDRRCQPSSNSSVTSVRPSRRKPNLLRLGLARSDGAYAPACIPPLRRSRIRLYARWPVYASPQGSRSRLTSVALAITSKNTLWSSSAEEESRIFLAFVTTSFVERWTPLASKTAGNPARSTALSRPKSDLHSFHFSHPVSPYLTVHVTP